MFIINFRDSRRSASAYGFLKGLAAPSMLYRNRRSPEFPKFEAIKAPNYSIADAIAGDWVRIGEDMSKVIDRYGKTTLQSEK